MRTAALALLAACLCLTLGCPGEEEGGRWTEVEALVRARDWTAAGAWLEDLRAREGDDPEILVRLAEVRRLQGEQAKAVLILRDALERQPGAKILYVPLATLYLQIGDPARAVTTLEKGREQGADPAAIALTLGSALGRLERYDEALAEFERARAAGSEPAVVSYNRALILGQKGQHAEARAALEEALRAKPDWAPAKRELARTLIATSGGDRAAIGRALDLLVELQPALPEDWRLQESIGDAWLALGDHDAALQAYTEALRLGKNPKSVEDRYRVAALRKRDAEAGEPAAK